MGTNWKFKRKPLRRPKKTPGQRRQKEKKQRKRLISMGYDQQFVEKLNGAQIRELLKNPKKIRP